MFGGLYTRRKFSVTFVLDQNNGTVFFQTMVF